MKKIYCMIAQVVLLLWFFLDMTGLYFGDKCLVGTTKVLVKGYAGNITSITDTNRTVVHEKQKANTTSKSSGLF